MGAPQDRSEDDVRASDAEREAAMTRLRDATAEGRLTFEELADRLDAAARARTRGELAALEADLPAEAAPAPVPVAGGVAPQRTVFGDLRREDRWRVPEHSVWRAVFGDVVLDLRQAVVAHPRVTIEASTVFGDVLLLVPEGIEVHLRGSSFFGDLRQDAGTDAPPGAPVVVLDGRTVFGDVKVRAQRLRERLAQRLLGPR